MYRLLIVDNEPNIVRGLKQLLAEEAPYELDVYGALSANEALAVMERTKIDIALLDIRMPGMNGLELQTVIAKNWPSCKSVFLSGYDDFSYIQSAMRGGGIDYVLKMDGDEAILQAIGKAIAELERSGEREQLLEQARAQWLQAIGARQNEYARQLVHGLASVRQDRLDELQTGLDAERPALLLVARVDRFDSEHTESDKALLRYAVQNIAAEHWSGFHHFSTLPEMPLLAAFIQPETTVGFARTTDISSTKSEALAANIGEPPRFGAMPREALDAELWSRLVHGKLEAIQNACRQYLNLAVSFAASTAPIEWHQLPAKYAELKQLLFYGFGSDDELLLTDAFNRNFGIEAAPELDATVARNKLRRLLSSELALEHRMLADFDELAELSRRGDQSRKFHAELYHGICYLLLSSDDSSSSAAEAESFERRDRLGKLLSLDTHVTWEDALAYLRSEIVKLIDEQARSNDEGAHFVVSKLKSYIDGHLGEDLSLVRLADVVYLNPTYLSRLFKQQTGQGVSEYIAGLRLGKSQELLRYSQIKIQDIAGKVGFDSATSFGRFFKRETNVTPQEYRDA
ncbi:helix-turn-helix domain-containing protein [Paenibacillus sp. strain BS8-2]